MLEIREQILSVIKEKKKLIVSEDKLMSEETVEFQNNEWFFIGTNRVTGKEEFRYSLSPKQALVKICDYYRKKGNIEAIPGYKQIYKYITENN